MHSFLFPEDISSVAVPQPNNVQKSVLELSNSKIPSMPSRTPPTVPQSAVFRVSSQPSQPSQPCYAPPPPPLKKDEPAISVKELSISDERVEPDLQRMKSKRSYRQAVSFTQFKDRREAKAVARADKTITSGDTESPPLSPLVDEEFWRTGRYPSSSQGFMLAHVPF